MVLAGIKVVDTSLVREAIDVARTIPFQPRDALMAFCRAAFRRDQIRTRS